MNVRSVFFLILWLTGVIAPLDSVFCQTDETNKLITFALSKGNAQALSDHFNSMVDLSLPGIEDSYGKTQATRIMQDFFSKNPVKSYKINKTGNSNDGSQFSIGKMEAGNKTFRLYYLIRKISNKYLIHQLQIQEEK
jgi:hypothetical protein